METQRVCGGRGGEAEAQVQLSVCLSGGFVTAPLSVHIPAHLLWMKHGQPCEEEEDGGRRLGGRSRNTMREDRGNDDWEGGGGRLGGRKKTGREEDRAKTGREEDRGMVTGRKRVGVKTGVEEVITMRVFRCVGCGSGHN